MMVVQWREAELRTRRRVRMEGDAVAPDGHAMRRCELIERLGKAARAQVDTRVRTRPSDHSELTVARGEGGVRER